MMEKVNESGRLPEAALTSSALSTLHAYLRDRAANDLFSGVVMLTRNGEVEMEGAYGLANRSWLAPATIDTRFDTASITKLFTAVAALQLVESGALSFDTPVNEFLGSVASKVDPRVELRHLLTHTSGLADDADEEAGEAYADIFRDKPSYRVRETSDLVDQFVDKPANFAPGEGRRYCNAGFVWAGLMIEKATGVGYRENITSGIFEPAGMRDSGFFSMDVVEPRVAEGADPSGGSWVRNIYSYPPIGSPDGGAHVTAADLDRFHAALVGESLLGPAMTKAFLTPQVKHHDDERGSVWYGYGLEFTFDPSRGLVFYEKEGVNAGVSAVLRHYPELGRTLVMLSNMEDGVWEPREHIHSLLTQR